MDGVAEFLTPAAIADMSIGLLVVLLFAFGRLTTKRELDYVRADRDARIAEARQESADWRAAHETSERARELQNEQVRELISGFRTLEHFFEALRAMGDRRHVE